LTDPFRLDGKTALITGANTGIGQAIALAMARAGAEVVAAGRSPVTETIDLIAADGHKARPLELVLDDPAAAAQTLLTLGPLDILVNNAGIIRRADAVDYTEADWDAVMDVNLKAAFFLAQAFARAAFARNAGGAIVNIASVLSFQGGIRIPAYTASKHGIAGLTKLLACEWAPKGINVNAVAPGYVATNNTEALRADEARYTAILDRIPAGRWADPADIANPVVFLASPAAAYIHGAILPVDGGWLAR
jgi:2-dehydro-3-deoxy-D-gluconate 5-dehydrogenase